MRELAEYVIKEGERLGASYVEVRSENAVMQGYLLKNGVAELGAFSERLGYGIRMLINGKLTFCSTDMPSKRNLRRLLSKAAHTVRAAAKVTPSRSMLAAAPTEVATYKATQKVPLSKVSPDEKISYLFDLDKAMDGLSSKYLSFGTAETDKLIMNSEGTVIESSIPSLNLFCIGTLGQGQGSMQRFWQKAAVGGFEFTKSWKMEAEIQAEIKAMRLNIKKAVPSPKGRLDVVAAPEVTGILVHESGGHPYEADRIFGREAAQAGESFITPKMIGDTLASPLVTLVDDPVVEHAAGYYLYDDEGVKARRKFLVKGGKITELMHSRETAPHLGLASNGAARASAFDREPMARMSNTFILPGDKSEEELIEGVKKGIYIKNFMEWNIDDTRVNQKYVGNEAYLIEHGKLTKPIRQPVIELSTFSLYKSIDALGNNLELFAGTCGKGEPMQGIAVSMGGPSIRLRNVRLGVRNA